MTLEMAQVVPGCCFAHVSRFAGPAKNKKPPTAESSQAASLSLNLKWEKNIFWNVQNHLFIIVINYGKINFKITMLFFGAERKC